MDVEPEKVEATLARIKPQLEAQDFELIARLWSTLMLVMRLVRAQRASIARLRRLFGMASSEKTRAVTGADTSTPAASPPADDAPHADGGAATEQSKPKGHGRLGASDYPTAQHHAVLHAELKIGERCSLCERGKLYELQEPARILRILGQPLLSAHCWDCQRLRCSTCGHVFTAQAPAQAQGPKFDETAVAMIALCRYGTGLPHHRLERLQRNLQTPISSSTQWDGLDQRAGEVKPVFALLEHLAAQGTVIHDDDTYVRILAFMGERRAKLLQSGDLPDPERTGLFTTAIVSNTEAGTIALFYSGRKHAGENLNKLLTAREPERDPPILMSDALARNVPKDHPVVQANCTAHARRGIVDQFPNFPLECRAVLEMLREVFAVEARCKQRKLSAQQRLLEHQTESRPVMDKLHAFMTEQLQRKLVEPNSGLGKAYEYMLKRWDKLTLFLQRPGAPLENNICERALKMAIFHRRGSLFYRTQHGASVGDMFTSLIHTAELHAVNPFEYLTEVLRHAAEVAAQPGDWLPWTYKSTLARLSFSQR
ncbi:MAG TPA: IS66 family transposase [Polyangiales bacterium]|nr:IS66 family transposase [Polyangiales bacterium]